MNHRQRNTGAVRGDDLPDALRYGYVLLAAAHGPADWTDHGLRCAARAIEHMGHRIAAELLIRSAVR